jgi:apolipoprotein N-acyltransferase
LTLAAHALAWGASALSGAALSAALAPGVPAFAGWLAPVPLLLALRTARGAAAATALAFVTGLVFWGLHVRWIVSLGGVNAANLGLSLLALAAVFSLFGTLVWAGRAAPVGCRWLVCGAAWVLAEYLRLHLGFAAMPWGSLAYSQIDLVPLAQVAAVAGLYGVGFVVIALASAAAETARCVWQRRVPAGGARLEIAAPFALLALVCAWGAQRLAPAPTAGLRVAFVQAGVYDREVDPDLTRRDVLDRYREQTLAAARSAPDLIVWPASSLPGRIPFDTALVRWVGGLAREVGRPLLVGSSGQEKTRPGLRDRPTANSAFLIDPAGEIVDRYDKVRLVPFNEYVPLRDIIGWPYWIGGDLVDATAGERHTVFALGVARFAVLICWENLFPGDFRSQVGEGVDFVVSMTNEAFTSDRGARHQMLTMNRLRAIESGIPVIRAATTGVSMAVDRNGRPLATITDASDDPVDATGFRVTRVPLGSAPTLYGRIGDWLPAASAGLLAALAWRRRTRSPAAGRS